MSLLRLKLRYTTAPASKRGKFQDHSLDEALRAVNNSGSRIVKKNGQVYLVARTFLTAPGLVVQPAGDMDYKTTTLFPTKAHKKRIAAGSFEGVYKDLMRSVMAQPPPKRKRVECRTVSSEVTSVTRHSIVIDPVIQKCALVKRRGSGVADPRWIMDDQHQTLENLCSVVRWAEQSSVARKVNFDTSVVDAIVDSAMENGAFTRGAGARCCQHLRAPARRPRGRRPSARVYRHTAPKSTCNYVPGLEYTPTRWGHTCLFFRGVRVKFAMRSWPPSVPCPAVAFPLHAEALHAGLEMALRRGVALVAPASRRRATSTQSWRRGVRGGRAGY